MTLNVQGMNEKIKHTKIFKYLREHKIDIGFLQETHASKSKHKIYKNEWNGKILFNDGSSNSKGVAIVFHKDLDIDIVHIGKDSEGRVLDVSCKLNGISMHLINVYTPNEDKTEFFTHILEGLELSSEDYKVLGGDLNVWLNPEKDKKGGHTSKYKASSCLINSFLEEYDWMDAWRVFHPDKFEFTWYRRKPLIMTRLDYFLTPLGTLQFVNNCEIEPNIFSDHNAVILTLETNSKLRGPGYWKLNLRHLQDKEFALEINKTVDFVDFRYGKLNPLNKWKMLKHDIRETSMSFSCRKALERKQKIEIWKRRLKTAKKKLAMLNLDSPHIIKQIEKLNDKIDKLKRCLEKETNLEIQRAILCTKARWVAESQKNPAYFFGLEKSRAHSGSMQRTLKEDGTITSNTKEILKVQAQFYEKLFTSDEYVSGEIPVQPERKLSDLQKVMLDQDISLEEVQATIKCMALKKSPGFDGIPVDLLIFIWDRIKGFFMEMLTYTLSNNLLHASARNGIISLIPKKE